MMTQYIFTDNDIISHKPFEKNVIKIVDGHKNDLDDEECYSAQALKINVMKSHDSGTPTSSMS